MRFTLANLCLVFALFVSPLAAQAQDASAQAKQYVDSVAKQAVGIIEQTQQGRLGADQAKENFRVILNNAFDVPTIAKFTMGRYWRVATPQQQNEFIALLKSNILDKYADHLLDASGNKYTLDATRQINETDYGVNMTGYNKVGQAVGFGWRVRHEGNKFMVIDIAVEGVSMSVTHRSDFASVIERNGGRVEALLDALRGKQFSGPQAQ